MNSINYDFETAFESVYSYSKSNHWKGYDPYDGLNSPSITKLLNNHKLLKIACIQANKKSPINFRKPLGIKKGLGVKCAGLFASSLLKYYKFTNEKKYLNDAYFLLDFLQKKSLKKQYNDHCWGGLHFPYQSMNEKITQNVPSAIGTVTCALAFLEDYKITHREQSLDIAESSINFALKNLLVERNGKKYFKYMVDSNPEDVIYNASAYIIMLFSNYSRYKKKNDLEKLSKTVIDYIISIQKSNGSWYYRLTNGKEKMQIDFHQGFILDSLMEFIDVFRPEEKKYSRALEKGLKFYYKEQFLLNGTSKFRWPDIYPIDIHNQAQGIITFSKTKQKKYMEFAKKISKWTVMNMQETDGHFYYQKGRFFNNKIPYMRWGQAWMMLALATQMENTHEK